jgi:adenine deaminase
MENERQAALDAARAAYDVAYTLCRAMNAAEKIPFRATILAARTAAKATLTAAQAAEDAAVAIDAGQAELDPGLMYAHHHAMRAAESARQYANLKIADLALLTGASESSGPEDRRSDGV